jgi:hypothetical protein
MHFYRVYSYNVVKTTDRSTYKIYLGQHFYTPIKDNKTTSDVRTIRLKSFYHQSVQKHFDKLAQTAF